MCEVVNIKNGCAYDVYIGRPSFWGNPFSHRAGTLASYRVRSRADAISSYEKLLLSSPDMLSHLPELVGKKLGCFCHPKPCHGHILKKYVDRIERGLPLTLF